MQPTIGVCRNFLVHVIVGDSKFGIDFRHMFVAFSVSGRVGRERCFNHSQSDYQGKFTKVPLVTGRDMAAFRLVAAKNRISSPGLAHICRLRNPGKSTVCEGDVLPLLNGGDKYIQHARARGWLVVRPNV